MWKAVAVGVLIAVVLIAIYEWINSSKPTHRDEGE